MKEFTYTLEITNFLDEKKEVQVKEHGYNNHDAEELGLLRIFYREHSGDTNHLKNAREIKILKIE